jgi:aminopeptidase N
MTRATLAALATSLVIVPAASADVGAPGVGDPYFPRAGNGGYDALHYDLRLRYSPRRDRLSGRARITARALVPLTRFNLDLKRLRVRGVQVNGARATFDRSGSELRITPATPLGAGQQFTVSVRYGGRPRTVIDSVIGGEPYGFVHTRDGQFVAAEPDAASTWFPCNDHPSDKATYTFRITVPKGLRTVANGRLVSRSTRRGASTFVWTEDSPMASYLATIDTGRWRIRTGRTRGGVPQTVAVDRRLSRARRKAMRFVSRTTAAATDFEAETFGPYPFGSTGAIVDDAQFRGRTLGFSLETQTRPVYSDVRDSVTIAHEIAHQWFGNSVSLRSWADIWLNEGFASFTEYLWIDHRTSASAHDVFKAQYALPARAAFWKVSIGNPGRARMFDIAVYYRGAMTLQALREKIGDGPFFTLLRTWVARYRHGNATTADFIALAEQLSGQELGPFFQTWLYTPRKPKRW